MPHIGEVGKHEGGGFLRGGDDAPGAPFAGVAGREADILKIGQVGAQLFGLGPGGAFVDVDHHGAAARGPVARDLGGRGPARYGSA